MRKIKLKAMMSGLQDQMYAKLSVSRRTQTHPGAIGDFSELEWHNFLKVYLPRRYTAEKGFVIDAMGNVSDQIDIIIFDTHYTPFVFYQNGARYIPAEAVYAVIECKQNISLSSLRYAAKKARTVRLLQRSSVPIVSANGTLAPKKLHNILGGIICVSGKLSSASKKYVEQLAPQECLNFGCSLDGTYYRVSNFDLWNKNNPPHAIQYSTNGSSLIKFVLTLISDLQDIGTVPAIDIKKYLSNL